MYCSITRCSNQNPEGRLPDVCYSKLVYDRWILVLKNFTRRDVVLIPVRLWLLLKLKFHCARIKGYLQVEFVAWNNDVMLKVSERSCRASPPFAPRCIYNTQRLWRAPKYDCYFTHHYISLSFSVLLSHHGC